MKFEYSVSPWLGIGVGRVGNFTGRVGSGLFPSGRVGSGQIGIKFSGQFGSNSGQNFMRFGSKSGQNFMQFGSNSG